MSPVYSEITHIPANKPGRVAISQLHLSSWQAGLRKSNLEQCFTSYLEQITSIPLNNRLQ